MVLNANNNKVIEEPFERKNIFKYKDMGEFKMIQKVQFSEN